MKYFSMFSGIGGFELGIQQSYESLCNKKEWRQGETKDLSVRNDGSVSEQSNVRQSSDCIGYSETNKYAIQIYERHFKHKNWGDATKITASELPDFDLLVGGFPCQSFSIAGKRGGFNDTRGTLFFDIARILRVKRPRLLLLENVKGLLSHDRGRTFDTIIRTLDGLGYDLQWQVLNSKNFGVPQNRERVFIIGHLRGTARPKVFPIGGSNTEVIQPTRNESIQEQEFCGSKQVKEVQINNTSMVGSRITKKGYSGTLDGTSGQGVRIYQDTSRKNPKQNGKGWKDDECYTLDVNSKNKIAIQKLEAKIRRLTPTECERLQGFSDGWTEGVSDTQRYKCLGNAVTVNVIEEIVERLF